MANPQKTAKTFLRWLENNATVTSNEGTGITPSRIRTPDDLKETGLLQRGDDFNDVNQLDDMFEAARQQLNREDTIGIHSPDRPTVAGAKGSGVVPKDPSVNIPPNRMNDLMSNDPEISNLLALIRAREFIAQQHNSKFNPGSIPQNIHKNKNDTFMHKGRETRQAGDLLSTKTLHETQKYNDPNARITGEEIGAFEDVAKDTSDYSGLIDILRQNAAKRSQIPFDSQYHFGNAPYSKYGIENLLRSEVSGAFPDVYNPQFDRLPKGFSDTVRPEAEHLASIMEEEIKAIMADPQRGPIVKKAMEDFRAPNTLADTSLTIQALMSIRDDLFSPRTKEIFRMFNEARPAGAMLNQNRSSKVFIPRQTLDESNEARAAANMANINRDQRKVNVAKKHDLNTVPAETNPYANKEAREFDSHDPESMHIAPKEFTPDKTFTPKKSVMEEIDLLGETDTMERQRVADQIADVEATIAANRSIHKGAPLPKGSIESEVAAAQETKRGLQYDKGPGKDTKDLVNSLHAVKDLSEAETRDVKRLTAQLLGDNDAARKVALADPTADIEMNISGSPLEGTTGGKPLAKATGPMNDEKIAERSLAQMLPDENDFAEAYRIFHTLRSEGASVKQAFDGARRTLGVHQTPGMKFKGKKPDPSIEMSSKVWFDPDVSDAGGVTSSHAAGADNFDPRRLEDIMPYKGKEVDNQSRILDHPQTPWPKHDPGNPPASDVTRVNPQSRWIQDFLGEMLTEGERPIGQGKDLAATKPNQKKVIARSSESERKKKKLLKEKQASTKAMKDLGYTYGNWTKELLGE